MNPADVPALANHLWQSTLFAGVAGLLTLALRKNPARVRHWVWLAASLKFLIPFSLLIALGSQVAWRTAVDATPSNVSIVMDKVSQPFTMAPVASVALPAAPPAVSRWPEVLWSVWALGFLGISGAWWTRWRRIRAAVRSGSPMQLDVPVRAVSSRALLEPGIFGIIRPVLLLPEGIFDRLTAAQSEAVIAHELCHIRRRDNLFAAIQMFVETVFWFHPLVWWIGKRMVEERERACDEDVLRLGVEPRIYAEGILAVCKLYVESPLRCVSGVTGSNLSKRIEAIMSNRVTVRLSLAKIAALAVAGVAAIAAPVIVGMTDTLPMLAQSQQSSARPAPGATPKFDVASVKPCKADNLAPGARRGGEGGNSPGTLRIDCSPVKNLINQAYVLFANGHVNPQAAQTPVEGGPGWINSEIYQIDAKTESPQSQGIMRGPMLQRLLEERFKLKIRRETRVVPAYALTVAKGGSRLRPFKEGSCTPLDLKLLEQFPPQPFPELPPGQEYCGGIDPEDGRRWVMASGTIKGPNEILYARALSIDEFIKMSLSRRVGRPVLNKTGLKGRFDYQLEFAPDQTMPGFGAGDSAETSAAASNPAGATIFAALQKQLGLKLEPAKGTGEFLVIDHVERPTGNDEAAQAPAFEAASIKPAVIPVGREGGNRSRIEHTPSSLTMLNVNLNDCVQWAYGVAFFQVSETHRSSESYDILAKTGTAVSVSQMRAMLRELLAERFKLAVHRENRMLAVYELVVAKGGPKLPAANPDNSPTHVAESLPQIQNDSFLFQNASMGQFAQMLAQLRGVELPVIDHTGIAGNFDIVLKSGPSLTREGDAAGLFAIITAQLGLKLESAKAPIEVIVIDRAEKPTEN